MKYLLAPIFFLMLIMQAAFAEDLDENKIYNFYQPSCPYCRQAILDIKQNYPGLQMVMLDITSDDRAYDLFMKCVYKFHIKKDTIGTPLFCMGNNYVMGWNTEQQLRFEMYVKKFWE